MLWLFRTGTCRVFQPFFSADSNCTSQTALHPVLTLSLLSNTNMTCWLTRDSQETNHNHRFENDSDTGSKVHWLYTASEECTAGAILASSTADKAHPQQPADDTLEQKDLRQISRNCLTESWKRHEQPKHNNDEYIGHELKIINDHASLLTLPRENLEQEQLAVQSVLQSSTRVASSSAASSGV